MSSEPHETDEPPWWAELLITISGGFPQVLVIVAIALPATALSGSAAFGAVAGIIGSLLLIRLVVVPLLARVGWGIRDDDLF